MNTDRARVKRLFRELQARLAEWDPLGAVAAGAPEDEYECVAGPLLRMLAEGATDLEIASYLNSDFNDHFGVRAAVVPSAVILRVRLAPVSGKPLGRLLSGHTRVILRV